MEGKTGIKHHLPSPSQLVISVITSIWRSSYSYPKKIISTWEMLYLMQINDLSKCSFQINYGYRVSIICGFQRKLYFCIFFFFIIKSVCQSFKFLTFNFFSVCLYTASYVCLWESGGKKCSTDFCVTEWPLMVGCLPNWIWLKLNSNS